MKLKQRIRAVVLRKKGWMMPTIRKELQVSKSTLSLWLRDITLTPKQKIQILKGRDYSRFMAGEKKKNNRIATTQQLIKEGRREALSLVNDSFFVSGVMLYWAEGAKKDGTLKFANSDPVMIKFMMKWLREMCAVPTEKFRISVHIHSLHCKPNIESYWSKITQIPKKQFYKTQIKKTSLRHRRNKLYNGTCTICVSDVKLFRKMLGWKVGILEKFYIPMQV